MWTNIWGNDNNETVAERTNWLKNDISKDAFEIGSSNESGLARIGYRLNEKRPEGKVYAYYGVVVGPDRHVQIAMYFDSESDLSEAKSIFNQIDEVKP